jgi:hypothetical protein
MRACTPCSPFAHPGGCGLRVDPPATFSRVWQSMQELSVWHVVQSPGSPRASSE